MYGNKSLNVIKIIKFLSQDICISMQLINCNKNITHYCKTNLCFVSLRI